MRLRRGADGGLPRILSEAQWALLGLLAQEDISVNAEPRDERVGMNTVNALVDRDLADLEVYTGTVRITPMGRRLLGCEAAVGVVSSGPAAASASSRQPDRATNEHCLLLALNLTRPQWALLRQLAQGPCTTSKNERLESVKPGVVAALVGRGLAEYGDEGAIVQISDIGRRLPGIEASLASEPIPTPEQMRRRIAEREDPLVAELTEKILKAIDLEWGMGPEPVFVPLGHKDLPKRVERMLKDQFAAKDWSLDYGTAAVAAGGTTERTVTATSIVGSQC